MENKKLESMAKVNKYIEMKYKTRMLYALKRNQQSSLKSDSNLRKAIQFHIFKHKTFLIKQTFRILKTWKKQKE